MKAEDAALRIPGDKPCSCSGDCDRYILALEAERDMLTAALQAILDEEGEGMYYPYGVRIAGIASTTLQRVKNGQAKDQAGSSNPEAPQE